MINLYNIDCMEFMADKPDNFYDLAIVDPPYNLSKWSSTGGNSLKKHEVDKTNQWDHMPNQNYFNELFRVSKNAIIWGGNHFLDFLGRCTSLIIWDKKMRGMHFADGEMAWSNFKKGALRICELPIAGANKNRTHPTQKPVELYRWLLKNYAKKGYKILDTHGGSGTICQACHDMGFDLDWCELDKEYFNRGKKRFEDHTSQLRMF
jgi:site-specific DNA-methyltransferase (adenine-specific)